MGEFRKQRLAAIVSDWTDSHLHEFTIGKTRYTEYPESKEEGLVSGGYRL